MHFKEEQQLAHGKGVYLRQGDGHIHLARLGQREGGGELLGMDQLVHRMAGKEIYLRHRRKALGNGHLIPIPLHPQEGDDLIEGALRVELNLGMLVRHP